jgi:glycosyltransferase involved in cell wall biosynthesis
MKPVSWPPISVVIPAHNEQRYLPKTLIELRQRVRELEIEMQIIVVNDASTDRTAEIAADFGAQVENVDLRNIGAVRNAGAAKAIHNWLFFLDADTLLPKKTLEQALKALQKGAAGGGAQVAIPDEKRIAFFKRLMFYSVRVAWLEIGGWAAGCFMFCRRDVFREFEGFDEEYFAAEELFFSRAVKARGLFRIVRSPVITSDRKLQNYSTLELVRLLLRPLTNPKGLLKSRFGLEILYEDDR